MKPLCKAPPVLWKNLQVNMDFVIRISPLTSGPQCQVSHQPDEPKRTLNLNLYIPTAFGSLSSVKSDYNSGYKSTNKLLIGYRMYEFYLVK